MIKYTKIKSVRRIEKPCTVYNFHVPKYESYIANGIVTHNCYTARNKGWSNPITHYININEIVDTTEQHLVKLGRKPKPNQQHDYLWSVDYGCHSDLSLDVTISDSPLYIIERFAKMDNALCTFATKSVTEEWKKVDPYGHTRIRYSIMPQYISSVVDVRTSPISKRLQSANELVEAGYEVHYNLSPIIMYEGKRWLHDWIDLFKEMNDTLTKKNKSQAAGELIWLTHSSNLHEVNLQWNERAESYLWNPDIQQTKRDKPDVICYEYKFRRQAMCLFEAILKREVPWLRIRYHI